MILTNLVHITIKKKDLFLSLLVCILFTFGFTVKNHAQTPHCHADEMMNQHAIQHNVQHEIKAFKESLQHLTPTRNGENVLNIPVVIHVIHQGESIGNGSNLTQARIMEQMQILNDDFSQSNSDQNQIPAEFRNVAADVEIQFCLATTDPNGNATEGIVRRQFGPIPSTTFMENNIKPQTQWDPTRYLNIWIIRMPDPAILGYAYLPMSSILNSSLDGVVISHLKIGNTNSTTKGRTLVHEVAHYFGVPHMWGSGYNDCNDDDNIADTPRRTIPYYGHPAYPQFTCGTSDMFMNFMDYVDDNCMFMFSEGQKAVMRSIVNNQRISLLSNNSTECNTTVSTNPSPAENDLVQLFPNPCHDDLTITVPDNQLIQQISIFDNSGKLIEFKTFANDSGSTMRQIATQSFKNGMFIVRIETYTGETYAKRFVRITE